MTFETPRPGSQREPPSAAAIAFVTTEHFTLTGARAATIAESSARAGIFLASVSGGLIALGFIGQASHLGAAFFAFGLILLPVLAFVGLTSFFRTFQSGLEDARYANRIACLRAFYLKHEPQLADYFLDVSTDERRLEHVGIPTSRLQKYLSMSGTIAVITSALVGSAVGLLGAVASGHSAWVAFIAGTAAAVAALVLMIRYLDAQIRAAQHAMGLEPKAP